MSGIERAEASDSYEWEKRASCATVDGDLMFPAHGATAQVRMAKAICAECVVLDQCLADAIKDPPRHGIRAGKNSVELRRLHREATGGQAAEMQSKYEEAVALRQNGKSLNYIARQLGYGSHSGVRALLESGAAEQEAAS